MSNSGGPSGVLVISAWVEEGGVLRARLTEISGLDLEQVLTMAVSTEEILTAVRHWLEVIHGGPRGAAADTPRGALGVTED